MRKREYSINAGEYKTTIRQAKKMLQNSWPKAWKCTEKYIRDRLGTAHSARVKEMGIKRDKITVAQLSEASAPGWGLEAPRTKLSSSGLGNSLNTTVSSRDFKINRLIESGADCWGEMSLAQGL